MHREQVQFGALEAPGELVLPADASGLVVFAQGGGGDPTPSDAIVAGTLHRHGLATLCFDALGPDASAQRRTALDIDLLAKRVGDALDWAQRDAATAQLPLGLIGADSGSAAVLRVAAARGGQVCAVVSRGGRPDLAGAAALACVDAPTLLIVGGDDTELLRLMRDALRRLRGAKRLEVVPGASQLFSERGALDAAAHLAGAWFANHLTLRRAA